MPKHIPLRRRLRKALPSRVNLWLADRDRRRDLKEIHERYKVKFEAVAKLKDPDRYEDVLHDRHIEIILASDDFLVDRTEYYRRLARRFAVDLPQRPRGDGEENVHWEWSSMFHVNVLGDRGVAEIARAIRREKKERREHLVFWMSWLLALAGAVSAVISTLISYIALTQR